MAATAERAACSDPGSGSSASSASGDEAHLDQAAEGEVAGASNNGLSEAAGPDGPALTCLLGPKQRQKALLQRQRQKREEREARSHWVQRWREYVKLNPDVVGGERDEMKAAFDEMQMREMHGDTADRMPKAHFSAVMSDLRRSRAVKDRELGTWRGYEPSRPAEGGQPKGRRRHRHRRRGHGGGAAAAPAAADAASPADGQGGGEAGAEAAEAPPPEADAEDPEALVTATLAVGKGLLGGLGGKAAAEFGRDLYILQTKFGVTVDVLWEESRLQMEGARGAIAGAKEELSGILRHYFPGEAFRDSAPKEKNAPKHWSETIQCNLSEAQKAKVLAQTQEDREKQRNAVMHWADRWDAYVKSNPDLVQTERAIMKDGFERMLAAEIGPETPGKVHFGLVMNFLRQSGRRQIATWKDYAPKGWNA